MRYVNEDATVEPKYCFELPKLVPSFRGGEWYAQFQ